MEKGYLHNWARKLNEITNAKTLMHELGHVLGMKHNKWWKWNKIEGVPENYCVSFQNNQNFNQFWDQNIRKENLMRGQFAIVVTYLKDFKI